jgi:hypothetical protein
MVSGVGGPDSPQRGLAIATLAVTRLALNARKATCGTLDGLTHLLRLLLLLHVAHVWRAAVLLRTLEAKVVWCLRKGTHDEYRIGSVKLSYI